MSHENENPLIIDVVGEVEPPESSERRSSKKSGRSAGKKGFFRRDKAVADTTATQAATEAEVDAAKRAAVAASVPPVQGPASQAAVAQNASSQPAPADDQVVSAQTEQEATAPVQQSEASAAFQQQTQADAQEAQPQAQQVVQPVEPQVQQAVPAAQPQSQVQTEAPQAYVPVQSVPVQPAIDSQPQSQAQQSAPAQQPAQPARSAQPHVQQPAQPAQPAQPQTQQPVQPVQPQVQQPVQPMQPSAVPVAVAPQAVPSNMAAAVAAPHRSRAVYVFVILAVLVVLFAAAAVGFFTFFPFADQTPLAPTVQADLESGEVRPIGSVSLDQASKVSIRATAEGWNEDTSTPVIAYIKRVDGASAADDANGDSKTSSDDERYFAFAPNKNASVSLPAGRYTFSFIAPMNSDGSMYSVPDMVSMVVGDGGMAVLPVDLTLIPKSDLTQEQITRALAQLKTASEKGGESFEYEPFKKSIDLALNTWFPHGDTTTEQPANDLTKEQQESLNAQADSQIEAQNNNNNDSSTAAPTVHAHTWVAQYQQRWEPEIVPVIDMAAWESPVYARYRCQEGVLFETLDACLAHVRERGNEPYTTSNEIIRIDYHPAVVHYEEQGHYVNVITGYRCSGCGATGSLS